MLTTRWVGPTFGISSVCLFVAFVFACSGENGQSGSHDPEFGGVGGDTSLRDPARDGRRCPANKEYIEESLDTSGDNVSDVRKVYRVEGKGKNTQKIIVCRELDLNHDGRKDIFRFFSEEGRPQRELLDNNFDGNIDSISYFENGRMVKQETDRNGDGKADQTRHFVHGTLLRVDRDDNNDGEIDVWEHWDQGRLVRIGYDVNNDKVADFWHRAPPTEEEEVVEEPPAEPENEESSEESEESEES